jgi:YfiH family protein
MFSFHNDPDTDGVGIAFFDAVAPDGARLDLTVHSPSGWRGPDWDLAEAQLRVPILNAYQVHGARVLSVGHQDDPAELAVEPADALFSTDRRLGLAVRAADCLPVLMADPDHGLIGAAHAGRVGLAAGVLVALAAQLRAHGATDLRAWIGPHICGDCYEVPADLQQDYCRILPQARAQTGWGTPSLDLGRAAAAQLAELGCQVNRVDPCTRTTPQLHSHRRDGAASGRQAGVIWLP